MKIKRFFAKDTRTVLLQVKEELGADAVIMSNKKVAGGVEVVAAIDGEQVASKAAASGKKQPSNTANRPKQAPATHSQYSNASKSSARQLEGDRVSLQGKSKSSPSMTKRFASMLNQYSQNGQASDNERSMDEQDSLSALMERQANARASDPSGMKINEDSPLARLIAEDRSSADRPYTPKLDPTRYDRSQKQEPEVSNDELEEMREEMTSIRRLLEHQVSGLMWQEVERREPLRAMLIKRLERMGLSLDLSDQLACYIPEDTPPPKAWKALLGLVSDQIPIAKKDILKHGGVVALLGPTGVGKTTTIAKLAARAAMEYGADNVALVTTDTYRIGAHEQLSIYGRIMGAL